MFRFAALALIVSATAFAADEPPPGERKKLQDVPIVESDDPPPQMKNGIQVQERRFWKDPTLGARAADLEVKVGRLWSEGPKTFAKVTVRNTSTYELDQIHVRCSALTQQGTELAFQERSFTASEGEPIRQGYSREVDFLLDDGGARIGSVSCMAKGF